MSNLKTEDQKVLYEAGYLLLSRGKIKAAREVFEGLIAMTPNKSLPYTFLGDTYFAELNFAEAIKAQKKALEIDPNSVMAMTHLGEALLASKQKDEGISILKKVVSLDPDGHSGKLAGSLLKAVEIGAL